MKRIALRGRSFFGAAAFVLTAGFVGASARAGDHATAHPVVVEMFLSQSCPKSPKAAEFMTELARRSDVVAIAWHVDYWDKISSRKYGAWADIFATPENGARQKAYNKRIRGRGVVFTPQAVVGGQISDVGSRRSAIDEDIETARRLDDEANPARPHLAFDRLSSEETNSLRVRIDKVAAPYDVILVRFMKAAETKITGGDNAGAIFREANIATGVEQLAARQQGVGVFSFAAPKDEAMGCAVLVQEHGQGRIIAAQYCPAARL
ncbi:MAG: DUF1223 domain-containing protein [Parvularculaceae bacterium]